MLTTLRSREMHFRSLPKSRRKSRLHTELRKRRRSPRRRREPTVLDKLLALMRIVHLNSHRTTTRVWNTMIKARAKADLRKLRFQT